MGTKGFFGESMGLRIGDRTTVAIETVAFGGEGLGRVDGKVLFVPFTVDGDVVEVVVEEVRNRFSRGQAIAMATPSPHRAKPRCPYFGRCGGCSYQHIEYGHQLRLKKQQVVDAFERIGMVSAPQVDDVIPSPLVYGYRGKADFHVEWAAGRPPRIGFMDTRGAGLVDIKRCEIIDDSINECLEDLSKKLAGGMARPVSEERLTLWSGDRRDGEGGTSTGNKLAVVQRIVGDRSFTVPAEGFFQANASLTESLVDEVRRIADLKGGEMVVDAYCGSGLFSLFLAADAGEITGIEASGDAVRCARINTAGAGFDNVRFIRGDAGEILNRHIAASGAAVDLLILDPPRIGCDTNALSAVAKIAPHKLVYVSCNPATQARDVRYLLERGFALRELTPIDMFPQTAHIEVIGTLLGSGRS
ncbi:MAG: class I SAM-dependent RNA methyltransferase [Deltaproteobacteria bacterium]|nr:class I SAM-dependent RNA methyltransferase [Deltaproteobacteria bacterium]